VPIASGSFGAMPKSKLRISREVAKARATPIPAPIVTTTTVWHDEAKDVAAPRAQSHTDSYLVCSSDRFIGHDAVEADRGKEQSYHSRDGREGQSKRSRREPHTPVSASGTRLGLLPARSSKRCGSEAADSTDRQSECPERGTRSRYGSHRRQQMTLRQEPPHSRFSERRSKEEMGRCHV
jgi:hypothetical protein